MSSPTRPRTGRKAPGPRRARGGAAAKPGAKSPRPGAKAKAKAEDGPPRLQKLLAQAGIASRRAAETLISQGRVRVDGRPVTELGTRVDPRQATVEVDGRVIEAQEPTYIVMNKPDECVSSAEATKDPRGRPTVVSLLGGLRTRVVPLGRLDYHTRGVLLLTNDGALHAALLHPRRAVPKTYHAKFQGKLGEHELAQLHAGVQLEDGTRTRPSLEVEVVRATTTNTWVQLTISQGLNRQIRRMGDAIGHSVLKLIRVAFAGITADGLREGQWRHLKPEEVASLYTLAGFKAPARDQVAPAATPRGLAVVRPRKSDRAAEAAEAAGSTMRRGRGARPTANAPAEDAPEPRPERSSTRGRRPEPAEAPTRSSTRGRRAEPADSGTRSPGRRARPELPERAAEGRRGAPSTGSARPAPSTARPTRTAKAPRPAGASGKDGPREGTRRVASPPSRPGTKGRSGPAKAHGKPHAKGGKSGPSRLASRKR